jgi:hypothetical protein
MGKHNGYGEHVYFFELKNVSVLFIVFAPPPPPQMLSM